MAGRKNVEPGLSCRRASDPVLQRSPHDIFLGKRLNPIGKNQRQAAKRPVFLAFDYASSTTGPVPRRYAGSLTLQGGSVSFRQTQQGAGAEQSAHDLATAGPGQALYEIDPGKLGDLTAWPPNSLPKKSPLNHFSNFLDNFWVS